VEGLTIHVVTWQNHNVLQKDLQLFIYIYALTDAFIQSDLHCTSRCTFSFLPVLAFPGKQTHDLGIPSTNALLFELLESIIKQQTVV